MTQHAAVFLLAKRLALSALCCAAFAVGLSVTASAQTWSPATYLGSYNGGGVSAPSFDPAGNAWVLCCGPGLQVVESNGASGSWQQPITLQPEGALSFDIKVDHLGAVNVVYSLETGSTFQLQSFRYVPGQGWQGPVMAYSSSDSIFLVGSAVDSNNNLVVAFIEGSNEGYVPPFSTWSIVYSSATGAWGTAQRLSPENASTLLWSLASDPAGANIMLVYASAIGPAQDIYSWKYIPSTRSWVGAAVPGTGRRPFSESDGVGGNSGHFPLAIDSSGNATLLADYVINGPAGPYTVYGFRYENGQWGEGVELLPLQDAGEAVDYFGSIAVDSSGIVVGAMGTSRDGGVVEAFRYLPGAGWDTEAAAGSPAQYTRTGVAFLGSTPGEAVIAYYSETGIPSYTVYLNGVWSAAAPILNTGIAWFYLEQAPTGQDLFVFQSATTPPGATWLNP
jgi:hypothetical protein